MQYLYSKNNILFEDELNMNEKFQPAENIDDAAHALVVQPLRNPDDPRYVDCSEVRKDVVGLIKRRLDLQREGEFLHLLFSGYRGNGKTTELFQLMRQIEGKYKTLYFDARKELDLNDMAFPDLLLVIAKMVAERMEKEGLPLQEKLLKQVGEWFYERLIEKTEQVKSELEVQAGIGTPSWFSYITAKILGTMKTSEEDRKIIRQKLRQDITNLIDYVNALLEEARKVTKEEAQKELLVIIDSLDRLYRGLEIDLFKHNGDNLRRLKCHLIYVVPVSLFYDPSAMQLPFDYIKMPMIPVQTPHGKPNEDSINLLREVIRRRFVLDEVLIDPEKTSRKFILASGGHIRDLIRMLHDACLEPIDKIDIEVAQKMINRLGEDYDMAIKDHQYNELMVTYDKKRVSINKDTQELIYNTAILVYQNPDESTWNDVHPALVNNSKFKKRLDEYYIRKKKRAGFESNEY